MEKLVHCPDTLYLMEFVVDSISIRKLETHYSRFGRSGIMFQFFDNSIEINEEEFADRSAMIGKRKIGKSCLFSISPAVAKSSNNQFIIDIKLYFRRGPHESKVCIATSGICITNLYNQIRMFMMEDNSVLPVSRSLKSAYTLRDYSLRPIGVVRFYLRLSCLGNSIITQFELGECDSSQRWEFEMGRSVTNMHCPHPSAGSNSLGLGLGASASATHAQLRHQQRVRAAAQAAAHAAARAANAAEAAESNATTGPPRKTKRKTDPIYASTPLVTKRHCHECNMGAVAAWAQQCRKFVEPVIPRTSRRSSEHLRHHVNVTKATTSNNYYCFNKSSVNIDDIVNSISNNHEIKNLHRSTKNIRHSDESKTSASHKDESSGLNVNDHDKLRRKGHGYGHYHGNIYNDIINNYKTRSQDLIGLNHISRNMQNNIGQGHFSINRTSKKSIYSISQDRSSLYQTSNNSFYSTSQDQVNANNIDNNLYQEDNYENHVHRNIQINIEQDHSSVHHTGKESMYSMSQDRSSANGIDKNANKSVGQELYGENNANKSTRNSTSQDRASTNHHKHCSRHKHSGACFSNNGNGYYSKAYDYNKITHANNGLNNTSFANIYINRTGRNGINLNNNGCADNINRCNGYRSTSNSNGNSNNNNNSNSNNNNNNVRKEKSNGIKLDRQLVFTSAHEMKTADRSTRSTRTTRASWGIGLTPSEYKLGCVCLALDDLEKKERLARITARNLASSAHAMHNFSKRMFEKRH